MPIEIENKTVETSNSFNLRFLFDLVEQSQPLFILSASHKQATLYRADPFSIEEVKVDDLPSDGMEAALALDEFPESQQFHASERQAGKSSASHGHTQQFHGQYSPASIDKKLMQQYFRKVNQAVAKFLNPSRTPLVFAGVDYLFPIYQSVNTYPKLSSKSLEGNFDRTRPEQILAKAKHAAY